MDLIVENELLPVKIVTIVRVDARFIKNKPILHVLGIEGRFRRAFGRHLDSEIL